MGYVKNFDERACIRHGRGWVSQRARNCASLTSDDRGRHISRISQGWSGTMSSIDLAGHVLDGERIIWSGAPASGLLFTSRDWFMIPFSLFWGGIVMFSAISALMQPNPSGSAIVWMLPLALLG